MKIRLFLAALFAMVWIMSSASNDLQAQALFRRPFDASVNVWNYVDLDTSSSCQIYTCTTGCAAGVGKTYNAHGGIDYMLNRDTPIKAGAAGTFYSRHDGCPNTGTFGDTCGSGFGNNVRLNHNGIYSIYAHLKSGTPISGTSNSTPVSCGQQVGLSASSGSSSDPHLHFELRTSPTTSSTRRDPYTGSCNATGYWFSTSSGQPTTQCQTSAYPAVSLLAPSNGATGQATTVAFDWSTAVGATSSTRYRLQVSTSSSLPSGETCTSPCVYNQAGTDNTSARTLSGFTSGRTYFWRVRAGDSQRGGQWSSIWQFTVR